LPGVGVEQGDQDDLFKGTEFWRDQKIMDGSINIHTIYLAARMSVS
jgi:hypothetical protein